MMEKVKSLVHPRGNLVKNRHAEIVIGLLLFLFGCLLLWDAFDGRGRKMPWPASGLMPF